MPFGADSFGSKEDVSQDRTNPFAVSKSDEWAMRPFAQLL